MPRALFAGLLLSCTVIAACGDSANPNPSEEPDPIVIVTPATQLEAGTEIAYCYYFRTSNSTEVAIREWQSTVGAGVERLNVILTDSDLGTPGTQSTNDCNPLVSASAGATGAWAYTAYQSAEDLTFPSNDGSGKPVGLVIPPGQSGYVYIAYRNATDATITSHVEVTALPYAAGTAITPASSFVAYNSSISIPAGATQSFTQTCATPTGAKFFWLSTYAHRQSVHSAIRDGGVTVFEGSDPLDPGAVTWSAPFFTFATGQLTYQLDYTNTSGTTITAGPSFISDEHGVALGYYFPASAPTLCVDGTTI